MIEFSKLQPHTGPIVLSSVSLATSNDSMSSCFILAGTPMALTVYIVIPEDDEWKYLPLRTIVTEVTQILAFIAASQEPRSVAILFRKDGGPKESGTDLVCSDILGGSSTTLDLSSIGGGAYSLSMAFTPSGLSDIYVAGFMGIGYYPNCSLQGTVSPIDLAFYISSSNLV